MQVKAKAASRWIGPRRCQCSSHAGGVTNAAFLAEHYEEREKGSTGCEQRKGKRVEAGMKQQMRDSAVQRRYELGTYASGGRTWVGGRFQRQLV